MNKLQGYVRFGAMLGLCSMPEESTPYELRELECMRRLLRAVGSDVPFAESMKEVARLVCNLMNADNGTIGLVSDNQESIQIVAAYQMPDDEVGSIAPRGTGLAGAVLDTGAPVRLNHYQELAVKSRNDLLENAVLGVPIMWENQMVGFFGLGRVPPGQFSDEDIERLLRFAPYAAIALTHFRLQQQSTRAHNDLAELYETSRLMNHAIAPAQVVKVFLERLVSSLSFRCSVALFEPNVPNAIRLMGSWDPDDGFEFEEMLLEYHVGKIDEQMMNGHSVLIDDVMNHPLASKELQEVQRTSGRSSVAFLPLTGRATCLGFVTLTTRNPVNWQQQDLRSYENACSLLALALEGRRNYIDGQHKQKQLELWEERRWIAQELHDSVCQMLFAIMLQSQTLSERAAGAEATISEPLAKILNLSQKALAEMRHLVRELQPAEKDATPLSGTLAEIRQLGLNQVVQKYLSNLESDSARIKLSFSEDFPQHVAEEWVLFRCMQEAVGNAVRHSNALSIRVEFSCNKRDVIMTIRDNGCGFDPKTVLFGLGQRSIQDRLETISGSLKIDSIVGTGTTVTARIPR